MANYRLLLHSSKQVVQVVNNGKRVLCGDEMSTIAVLEDSNGLSVVVDSNGLIADIGADDAIKEKYKGVAFDKTINVNGNCIIPGFVDGHTHAVWMGDRVHEFAMKLAGATYMDVHKAGGGIMFTVDQVRKASEDDLYAAFRGYAIKMLQAGTTTMECKSGYGLDADTEIKMLRVMERGRRDESLPIEISSTYCGAHAVPKGSTPEAATNDVIDIQLPRIQALIQRGDLHVENIDVFCEQGVFNVEQTRRILEAGTKMGLAINFHGEELHRLHSAEMGAELGCRAISHLEEVSDDGIRAMAKAGSIGVVLPTTAYILRLQPPPVRKMVDGGMAVALGSDFNPNAHCLAMPVVLHLACVMMRMSMPEALAAATINAAASIGRGETHGSIEVGKVGDMLVLDAPRWEHLVYQLGSYHHMITHVIKGGNVVHQRDS